MTAPDRDPFALAGTGNNDAEILALFHRWLAESRFADATDDSDEDGFEAAIDRRDEIEDQIVALRAGPIGLAVKSYLYFRFECPDWAPAIEIIRDGALFKADGMSGQECLMVSILRDAAAVVPEIGECAAPVIHEDAALIDAEIEIRWCRKMLTQKPRGATPCRELQSKAASLLDRIAKTEAKTARGAAVKAAALIQGDAP